MRYPDNEKRNMHGSCCCPLSVPNIVGETHRGGHRRLDFYIIYCRSFPAYFLSYGFSHALRFFFFLRIPIAELAAIYDFWGNQA